MIAADFDIWQLHLVKFLDERCMALSIRRTWLETVAILSDFLTVLKKRSGEVGATVNCLERPTKLKDF